MSAPQLSGRSARVLRQRPGKDVIRGGRKLRAHVTQGGWLVTHMGPEDRNLRLPRVRRHACETLEEDAAEGVHVDPRIDLATFDLLRGHVVDRPYELAGARDAAVRVDVLREPEIGQVGMVLSRGPGLEEDVGGLDVPMNEAPLVGRVQRAGHLSPDAKDSRGGQPVVLSRQRLQVRPVDVAHRDVENSLGVARVVDRDDVRVQQRGGRSRLADEPFAEALVLGQLRREQLEGDHVPEPQVLGAIHHAHAATTADALDPVSGENRSDPRFGRHGHF